MLPLIGLGIGAIGAIGKLFGNRRANKRLEQLIGQDPTYKANPIAGDRMALAQQLLNSRSPGAANVERNIYGSQGNALANASKYATDSSQMLAAGGMAQGQSNEAFENLGQQETQDYQRRYGNLVGAQEGMIQEGDKVYQDQVRRFEDLAKIRGAQNANTQNSWQGVSNLGFGLANFGLSAGPNIWQELLGKK